MRDTLFHIFFVWYPYVCLTVFLIGSLIRFDREQYTWRASSSQMLRAKQLRWGSNLFHIGILMLFVGHFVGLLTPKAIYTTVMTVPQKQMLAIVMGSIFGVICFIGLTMLLHRRLFDPRIRKNSTFMDNAVLIILWVQLVIGLATIPFSLSHSDGLVMTKLSAWVQGIVTLRPVAYETLQGIEWHYLAHLLLGMTIFLIFPFTRLVHVWSAPVWYLGRRGYQIVRTRRSVQPASAPAPAAARKPMGRPAQPVQQPAE